MNTNKIAVFSVIMLLGLNTSAWGAELKSDIDRANYSVGYQIGTDFKSQGMVLNKEAMLKGIEDALSEGDPQLTPQEMSTALTEMRKKLAAAHQERLVKVARENLAKAEAFLSENGKKEGITTLESGLQYKVIKTGSGASPQLSDFVTVHYRGSLIDGSEFDSSFKRDKPATFGVGQVIPGWTEALKLMKEGGTWQLFIPPKLGYGAAGAGPIPPNSALIFEVELISINSKGGDS